MGAVQRLATVVIVGLVGLATILLLYTADENNRITAKEQEQKNAAIERATQNYISLCLPCHGPAGAGYEEPGAKGTGRIGMPLGGSRTSVNQQGVDANGTPVAGGLEARTALIRKTIHEGRGRMPAWGVENAGPLNNEQINELVTMIQNADWNRVYNQAIAFYGGYPTPPAAPSAAQATQPPATTAAGNAAVYEVDAVDVAFTQMQLTIPAGQPVTIHLINKGAGPHNFSIDALKISVDVQAGESKDIPITAPAGTYDFYCNVPGHREQGMVGKLTADPNAKPPAAITPAAPSAPAGSPTAPANQGAAATNPTILAIDPLNFQPTEVTIAANTPTKLTVKNNASAPHNFAIDALKINVDLQPGETKDVPINAPAGTYEYYCNVPGHKESGMVGKLVVQ